jgi:hypothetical protein
MGFEDQLHEVNSWIANRESSPEWINSPDRTPSVMKQAFNRGEAIEFTSETRTRIDEETGEIVMYTVEVPSKYMYTGQEMEDELNKIALRAENDPRARYDFARRSRFSEAELRKHVIPNLHYTHPTAAQIQRNLDSQPIY